MDDIHGYVVADDDRGKQVAVGNARVSLMRVSTLFAIEPLMDDLDKLVESGYLPNFVQLDEVAKRNGVDFTPDLVALMVTVGLHHWDTFGAEGLSAAPYVAFDELDGEPRRIELLRSWLKACAELAGYHHGDGTDRDSVSEAFRLLGLRLADWDLEAAVSCGLTACGLALDGSPILAAADALLDVAGRRNDDAARMALTFRVLGMYRLHRAGTAVKLELYDAFEAACRYAPDGPGREVSRVVLGEVVDELEFLWPHRFLWKCVFDPDGLDPGLEFASGYAQPVWHFDDDALMYAVRELAPIISALETRRLELMPQDKDAVAVTDLNNWSIDHRAFRRAIPFSRSLLREADRSDLLLILSHEVIHIQSALGWLGANLAALRIAATECELSLLAISGELPTEAEAAQDPELRLATLPDRDLVVLAMVEQQLELVRKSQLLRAIWLPWLEGIAVFGELSADPTLDSEMSTMFSDVISSLNDATPPQVAAERGLSIEDASRAIRADAEHLYADALADSGRARLRTYLDRGPERYLAGYLAVRAVLTSLRRFHPFNGLVGYQALFGLTTIGTRFAVPSLTLPPREFEAQTRSRMLDWLRRVSDLDRESVVTLATAPGWKWVGEGARDQVVETDTDDPASLMTRSDIVPPLAMGARTPRTGRGSEFGELAPDRAAFAGQMLDLVAERMPAADERLVEVLADYLNDRISLVPIAQVTAPFWLSLGGAVPRLAVAIRVTETEREKGQPSYDFCMIPLSAEKLALLQEQMQLLRSWRMEVRRYADISRYLPGNDQGRGLGRNVLGFAYGTFTLVFAVGPLAGVSPSPSLTMSVENRLRPPSIVALDTMVTTGAAIARRAIDWIESQDFAAELAARPEIEAWTKRVLALANVVLKDDDAMLVAEASNLILTELGWEDGEFDRVRESGLRALYDDDSAVLSPLLDAAMVSAVGISEADVGDIPERVKSLLFEPTTRGYDFRRFKGAGS